MKRRFECYQGTSNKFWECEVVGEPGPSSLSWLFKVRHGRIGGRAVTEDPKRFARRSSADYKESVKVREKLRKGYTEVTVAEVLPDNVGRALDRFDDGLSLSARARVAKKKAAKPKPPPAETEPSDPDINERFTMLEFD